MSRPFAILATIAGAACIGQALAAEASSDLIGRWRLTHAVRAPWFDAASPNPIQKGWIGASAEFAAAEAKGPGPLSCANARYEATRVPVEGLFMGGFETDDESDIRKAAASLGLVGGPFDGVSLTCDAGIFEFHSADADTMLFALDNVIWTMSRAEGALARANTRERTVEAFLEAHFAGDMGFTEDSVAAKRRFLSRALRRKIADYFSRDFGCEAPPIDGDAFTDSQEYPTRFAVRAAGAANSAPTDIAVDFADGYAAKRVAYRLIKSGGRWRIDELYYSDGSTLSELLVMPN